ncbi:hypothetical protein GCM10010508_41360 [Streptomyces naganishii JCM 4654]|uniref:Uncharacterized protein n=1 Tax=Streptomyces naganishii JCM 4654 TaxID=1306179 RepID=A0A918Y6K2_9ACTN|nr:hypothetical protein GCM10010508_41360 [Streptomyces naganishii JCM 4654]
MQQAREGGDGQSGVPQHPLPHGHDEVPGGTAALFGVTVGAIGLAVGSVRVTAGAIGLMVGSVRVVVCPLGVVVGALGVVVGALRVRVGSVRVVVGALRVTVRVSGGGHGYSRAGSRARIGVVGACRLRCGHLKALPVSRPLFAAASRDRRRAPIRDASTRPAAELPGGAPRRGRGAGPRAARGPGVVRRCG